MISCDRDALICDLAETYGIFDMNAVPVSLLATLAAGLRNDSRIKTKLMHRNNPDEPEVNIDSLLLAKISDSLAWIVWSMTEDARKKRNMPPSMVDILLGRDKKDKKKENSELQTFESPAAFLDAWNTMGGG